MTALSARLQVRKAPTLSGFPGHHFVTVEAADGRRYQKLLGCSTARARLLLGEITASGSIDPLLWAEVTPQTQEADMHDDDMPGTPGAAPRPIVTPGTASDPAVARLADVLHHLPEFRRPFAADLVRQAHDGRRPLSARQLEWVGKLVAMAEDAMRPAQTISAPKIAAEPAERFDGITALFAKARESGLKEPALRVSLGPNKGKLRIAPRRGGYLAVCEDPGDHFRGRINAEGVYVGAADVLPALRDLNADPTGAAVRYGRETGSCSCCGRTLTDPESIARGIGPICAARWQL